MVFGVNGTDFTDMVAYEGYSFTEEDLHADGSGRNPLTGKMEFVVVAQKRYVDVTFVNMSDPVRVRALMNTVKANNRVNQYTAYNPATNQEETFTGYVNTRKIDIFNRYASTTNVKEFTLHIVEM